MQAAGQSSNKRTRYDNIEDAFGATHVCRLEAPKHLPRSLHQLSCTSHVPTACGALLLGTGSSATSWKPKSVVRADAGAAADVPHRVMANYTALASCHCTQIRDMI